MRQKGRRKGGTKTTVPRFLCSSNGPGSWSNLVPFIRLPHFPIPSSNQNSTRPCLFPPVVFPGDSPRFSNRSVRPQFYLSALISFSSHLCSFIKLSLPFAELITSLKVFKSKVQKDLEKNRIMTNPKLTRIPSIRERVEDTLSAHRNELVSLLSRYGSSLLQLCFSLWVSSVLFI